MMSFIIMSFSYPYKLNSKTADQWVATKNQSWTRETIKFLAFVCGTNVPSCPTQFLFIVFPQLFSGLAS